jgi:hypothetical protein
MTWGRMQTRKACDFQRPISMIGSAEWLARNKPMAAPDRTDSVPMSILSNPKTCLPPRVEQVCRSWLRRNQLASWRVTRPWLDWWVQVLIVVDPKKRTTRPRIRSISDAARRTGQRTGSLVRFWICRAFLSPFFWSANSKVTQTASEMPG